MSRLRRLSSGSVSCRLEWRPSRWLATAIVLLALLAAFSVLASEMPHWLAGPLAFGAASYGFRQFMDYLRQPQLELVFPGDERPPTLQGRVLENVDLQWRGPLAFLRWRDGSGRVRRLSWWPDTLPPARRRELRLAAGSGGASRGRPAMAP